MSSKRLHYSDEKWLDMISECRSSGLSDKDWCMEHQIGISTFYYHVKRLRNKACSIPPAAVGAVIPCLSKELLNIWSRFTAGCMRNSEETSFTQTKFHVRYCMRMAERQLRNPTCGFIKAEAMGSIQWHCMNISQAGQASIRLNS